MPERAKDESISAAWFLYSEAGEPLGPIFRRSDEAVPSVGERITNVGGWTTAEVVEVEELRPTCAVQRYRVVLRMIEL